MKGKELAKLQALLAEAPSSVSECAALLELPRRRVQIGIWQLTRLGRARVVGFASNPDVGSGFRKQLNLYSALSEGEQPT